MSTDREPLYLPKPEDVDRGVDRTIDNWRTWSQEYDGAGDRWSDAVLRSALLLKALLFAPTGAIAAAATTSLPEGPGGGNNWDYRFAWTRDMTFTLKSLFRFGLREETHAGVSWLLATIRRHDPEPRVIYRLDGGLPRETVFQDVPGWRGIGPVVSGNRASGQLQLGVLGDLFMTMQVYVDHGNVLDDDTGRLLAGIADRACDLWHAKDSGMWEVTELRHYTTSKIGCWQALQCAVALAEAGQIPGDPSRWRSEAERIRAWVEEHLLGRRPRRLRLVPRLTRPGRLDLAARDQRLRPGDEDALDRRPAARNWAPARTSTGIRGSTRPRAASSPARSGWCRPSTCSAGRRRPGS